MSNRLGVAQFERCPAKEPGQHPMGAFRGTTCKQSDKNKRTEAVDVVLPDEPNLAGVL